jgi:transcriptional regulator with XRE-family HTH domain
MKKPELLVDKIIGPVTVGSLLRSYRLNNELTQEHLAKKLKMTKPMLQRIESGKHRLTLKEVLSITKKLDEPKTIYAKVWCEEEVRLNGLDLDDLMRVI